MNGRAETQNPEECSFHYAPLLWEENTQAGSTYWDLRKKHREKENKGWEHAEISEEAGKVKELRKSEEKEV